MDKEELKKKADDFAARVSAIDGTCKYEQKQGGFSKRWLEADGLIRMTGATGKTLIVIEYDADTEQGWHRVVSEDPENIATRQYRTEHQREEQRNPRDHSRCEK